MADFEKSIEELRIKDAVIGAIMTALGLLVALTWKDTIQQTVVFYFPQQTGLAYAYYVTIIITVVSVVGAWLLIRMQKADISELAFKSMIENMHVKKNTKIERKKVTVERNMF